jgi:uncharacterized ubiquitin-like protein YukD
MTRCKGIFGGTTKAIDGVIATLELDGVRSVRHFYQVLNSESTEKRTATGGVIRTVTKDPIESPNQQLIDYCDRTGSRIVSISSPETIARDLRGPRVDSGVRPGKKHRQMNVKIPEVHMVEGRLDLLLGRD